MLLDCTEPRLCLALREWGARKPAKRDAEEIISLRSYLIKDRKIAFVI